MNEVEENKEIPKPKSDTGWLPGSIGDISARIGYDVRDLKMAGYCDAEIDEVLCGNLSVQELLKIGPKKQNKNART